MVEKFEKKFLGTWWVNKLPVVNESQYSPKRTAMFDDYIVKFLLIIKKCSNKKIKNETFLLDKDTDQGPTKDIN